MNVVKLGVVLGALASTALAGIAGSIPAADSVAGAMPAIERANREWSRAMKSGDADAIAAPYAMDAVFVTADGSAIRGREAIRDLYRARLAGKAPIVSAVIERRGTAAGDRDLVYEWGMGSVTTQAVSGTLEMRVGPYLTVWKRQESGRWEITRNVVL
jgi:uncharacterized protein (TIGR02246 family)